MTTSSTDNNINLHSNNSLSTVSNNGVSGIESVNSSTRTRTLQYSNGSNMINESLGTSGGNIVGAAATVNSNPNEMSRRRKLKSRTTLMTTSSSEGYSKDHLDAWLETCLRDASNTQLSSSSEFLDYNPRATHGAITAPTTTTTYNSKNVIQSRQLPYSYNNSINVNQQQQSNVRMNCGGNNQFVGPVSQNFQKNVTNFVKQTQSFPNRFSTMFPSLGTGAVGITGNNYYPQNEYSHDFASLPPMVNILGNSGGGGGGGNSSELENNSTNILDGGNCNPNINTGFRFSDPCLLNPSDNDSKMSDQNTPDKRNTLTNTSDDNVNKFFTLLMEQIQILHETNAKICRNLHETKVDIEALKHAPTWGLRHRRDSISGLSTHSQPLIFGGGFGGGQSPAPTYHSGTYTPGMMTDVVREVKEAARIREDALLNRVKGLVEERQWSLNESNLGLIHDMEELKSQVHHLRLERKEANKRLNHLEAENKYMRQILASMFNSRNIPDVIYENETLKPRKTFSHTRRTPPLNLNYGTIHHQPAAPSMSISQEEQATDSLHIIESPTITVPIKGSSEIRNSFSSSDGGDGGGSITNVKTGPIMSPPNFALISSPTDEHKWEMDIATKQTNHSNNSTVEFNASSSTKISPQELRQELKDAVTARKDADERIIALEKLVKKLQHNSTYTKGSTSTPFQTCPTTASISTAITNITLSEQQSQSVNGDNIVTSLIDVAKTNKFSNRSEFITSTSANKDNNNKRLQNATKLTSNLITNLVTHNVPAQLGVTGPITDL